MTIPWAFMMKKGPIDWFGPSLPHSAVSRYTKTSSQAQQIKFKMQQIESFFSPYLKWPFDCGQS